MTDTWQRQRSVLNHDWLKNDFLLSVNAFIARIGKDKPDDTRLAEFLEIDLPAWESKEAQFRMLLASAEQALSPIRLFDEQTLYLWKPDTLTWLPELVHALWLARYPIRQWIESASHALDAVNAAYEQIINELAPHRRNESFNLRESSGKGFQTLADTLQALSAAISVLPRKILVT